MVPDQISAKNYIKSALEMFLLTVVFVERSSKFINKSSLSAAVPVVRIL